jgi:type IV pilus assembly protein PilC
MAFNLTKNEKVDYRDVVIFTRQLQMMLTARVPIVQSFDILAQQTNSPKLSQTLDKIKQDIEAGFSFYDALKQHSKFLTVFTSIW